MPPSVTLRTAVPADAETLCRLIDALADYERLADFSHPDPEALRRDLRETAHPRCEAILAETEDRAVGFALFYPIYSTFATGWGLYLEDLFVEPAYRGRGIGLALLRRLAELAEARGAIRLQWQVLDWNRPAIDFYERLGATFTDEWRTMRLEGEALHRLAGVGG